MPKNSRRVRIVIGYWREDYELLARAASDRGYDGPADLGRARLAPILLREKKKKKQVV